MKESPIEEMMSRKELEKYLIQNSIGLYLMSPEERRQKLCTYSREDLMEAVGFIEKNKSREIFPDAEPIEFNPVVNSDSSKEIQKEKKI